MGERDRGSDAVGACVSGAALQEHGALPGGCSSLSLWNKVRAEEEGFPSIEEVVKQRRVWCSEVELLWVYKWSGNPPSGAKQVREHWGGLGGWFGGGFNCKLGLFWFR